MDLTTAPTTATVIENEAPPPPPPPIAHPSKPFSLSNGALRKHSNHHPRPPAALVVSYRECLRNHAARLGGHALDGCGEFMPSPAANSADPTSLKCAACDCHRNFHRREEDPTTTTYFLDFQRRPPLPPSTIQSSPLSSSPSPPPPPQQPPYYSSVPHMLLALSTAAVPGDKPTTTDNRPETPTAAKRIGRKRFRTKFSREQKEKMLSFSEKVGWKIQRSDEGLVEDFCNEVGVGRGVLKVWMHNNKHTFAKRSEIAAAAAPVDEAIDRNGRILGFDNTCRHNSPTPTTSSPQQSEDNNGVHPSASSSGSPSSSWSEERRKSK